MESLISYIKNHHLFGILVGLLFLLAAIFKWNWLLEPIGSRFMMFIYEMFRGELCQNSYWYYRNYNNSIIYNGLDNKKMNSKNKK